MSTIYGEGFVADIEEEPEDDGFCVACAGTGEGAYDGASCSSCDGYGYIKSKPEPDEGD